VFTQFRNCLVLLALFASALLTGCAGTAPQMPEMPPPSVTVSYPLEREVIDHVELTGRTAAVESVQVRARVWGHLQKINFSEGTEVKKSDLLFLIDQRPYQAALKRAEADVEQSEARYNRVRADHSRARTMVGTRSISQEEFDRTAGELLETQAMVRAAKAALEAARLNLDYTEVRAPVSGQIGRAMVTVGNMVTSGETGGTMLTTIVSLDPMYAYFDVDELTFLQVRHLLRKGKGDESDTMPSVTLGLANEQDYPHQGMIDFADNQVDPNTGTLKVRGVFDNDDRALAPGLFVRVRLPVGGAHKAVLVTDRAVDTDQGQKVMYVVGKDNVVDKRPVQLGRLHDGLREIVSGVKSDEQVVVDGIQRVRGGVTVAPRLVDMPVSKAKATEKQVSPQRALRALRGKTERREGE
jgi:RND family efflux transporter MFP subunit